MSFRAKESARIKADGKGERDAQLPPKSTRTKIGALIHKGIKMKKLAIVSAVFLAACSTPNEPGAGFGDSVGSSAPVERAKTFSDTPVTNARPATSDLRPIKASGPIPPSLATIRPRIIERMQEAEPVPVYETIASVNVSDLINLTPAAKAAIDAGPPKPTFFKAQERASLAFGLVLGSVVRVRVNGMDFAQMFTGTLVELTPTPRTFDLIAYRSGCDWNGIGDGGFAEHPYYPSKTIGLYYVGLDCG